MQNLRKTFKPPTPQERRVAIEAMRWRLFELLLYTPHGPQTDVHISDARYRMAIAGTRGGKSLFAAMEAVVYLFAGAVRIWIVGQKYDFCEKEFRYIFECMTSPQIIEMLGFHPFDRSMGGRCVYNQDQGNMSMRTVWGAEVQCISLDKEGGGLGEEVDLIIMAEAGQIKNPKRVWQRVLRGRLASRLGDLIVPTTPAGKQPRHDPDGWLLEMYDSGLDYNQSDCYTREWPSWENPHFPEDPAELQRTLDPLIFAEQYGGKFVVFSGAVYRLFEERVHVIPPFPIPDHWNRYEAVDPGHSGKFFHSSSVVSEDDNVYIVGEASGSELLYEEQAELIFNSRCEQYQIPHGMWEIFSRKHGIRTVTYFDPEDSQARAELGHLGIPGLKANNSVDFGIDKVNRRLKFSAHRAPTLYICSNCTETISAMKQHGWGEKGSTDTRKPANDVWKHPCDDIRYICAGQIVPSESLQAPEPEREGMWEIMEEMAALQNTHPFDMTLHERRAVVV